MTQKPINEIIDTFICDDVLNGLKLIPDESISLICTSPPYNCGIKYGNRNDNEPWDHYILWLKNIMIECQRVLRNGGRLVINIDSIVNHEGDNGKGEQKDQCEYFRPIYADLVNAGREIGLNFRCDICWFKHQVVGRATAWGCYDDQTRVMTNSGWKLFKDININNDYFATLNIKTGNVEYQKATNYFCYNYNGEMFKLKSRGFDLLVTPNHNMLLYNNYKKKLEFRKIENCPVNISIPQTHNGITAGQYVQNFILPSCEYKPRTNPSYKKNSIFIDMNDWLMFLGIFFTDGNVYHSEEKGIYKVSIYQSKQQHFNEIESLLKRLPFNFVRKESKHEWYTCSKQLSSYLKSFGNKNNRILPDFILNLNKEQKNLFLHWLFIGDGHIGETSYLAVSSKLFLDKLSRICLDVGMAFSIHQKISKERMYKNKLFKSNYPIYIINVKKSKYYHLRKKYNNIQKQHYVGNVFCVEVPNHTLFVERNGKTAWCGNSYMSCSNPIIRRNHEYLLVWSKGSWMLPGDSEQSDMTDEEFQTYTMSFWHINPDRRESGHPAPFPKELVSRCIKLFSYRGDIILDPFMGSGTTAYIAKKIGRHFIGIDNDKKWVDYAKNRLASNADVFDVSETYVPRSQRIKAKTLGKE